MSLSAVIDSIGGSLVTSNAGSADSLALRRAMVTSLSSPCSSGARTSSSAAPDAAEDSFASASCAAARLRRDLAR
jgi:hypothetical protein